MTFFRHPLIVVALSFAGIVAVPACSGNGPSELSGKTKSVAALAIEPATQGCPAGHQHPKICCDNGGPDHLAECVQQIDDPFADCPAGWTQYDDGGRCCAGDDLSQCLECNDGNCGDIPQPPPSDTCIDACPPGWFGASIHSAEGCQQAQAVDDGIVVEGFGIPGSNAKFCLGACPDALNHDPDHPCCALTNKPGGATGFPLDIEVDCSYPLGG